MYEPREDSILLKRYVRKYAKGNVLDMGTGSGVQALAAVKNKKVKQVIATDIQDSIIDYNKKNIINNKIKFKKSDLFDHINNKKFDTIIFNPPYLPEDVRVKDLTLDGGKKGYEVIERFLNEVSNYLKTNGIILIIFSSLTKKEKIDEFIEKNLLEFKLLKKQHVFFEDLYVYLIKKSPLFKKFEKKNIKNIKYFARGKRGLIFIGNYKNKKIIIKIKNPKSEAILRINNEINFLKILNKKNIGPKLLFSNKDYLVYEFVDGQFIFDFLRNNNKNNIIKVLKNLFEQLFTMDKLKINKEEMSHPPKHIIIKKNKPVLIDFERSHYTLKPSNVTQFCNFLISKYISTLLKNNRIKINNKKIIKFAKIYKININKNNLNKIINEIK